MALFPQLTKQRERYSLIRSMEAWDSVHFRAQYYVQSGHMIMIDQHEVRPGVRFDQVARQDAAVAHLRLAVAIRDWDHHNRIYAEGNHYKLCREIDTALTSLFDDLSARKRADGRTLLDETMVICFGEFGRRPGELSAANGRDHYQYALTGLFAGGGVQGGRVIGKTDELGAKVVTPDWQALGLHGRRRYDDLFGAGHRLVEGDRRRPFGTRVPLHRAVRLEADDQEPGDHELVRLTQAASRSRCAGAAPFGVIARPLRAPPVGPSMQSRGGCRLRDSCSGC